MIGLFFTKTEINFDWAAERRVLIFIAPELQLTVVAKTLTRKLHLYETPHPLAVAKVKTRHSEQFIHSPPPRRRRRVRRRALPGSCASESTYWLGNGGQCIKMLVSATQTGRRVRFFFLC